MFFDGKNPIIIILSVIFGGMNAHDYFSDWISFPIFFRRIPNFLKLLFIKSSDNHFIPSAFFCFIHSQISLIYNFS